MTQEDEQSVADLSRILSSEEEIPEDVEFSAQEFREALDTVVKASEVIAQIASSLDGIREMGLREQDLRDLIWARESSLNKGEIEDVFDTIDEIREKVEVSSTRYELVVDLISRVGGIKKKSTGLVLDEVMLLSRRYESELEEND